MTALLELPKRTDDYDWTLDGDDSVFLVRAEEQEKVPRIADEPSALSHAVLGSSVSHMTKSHRATARRRAKQAALLMYHHRGEVHYTQGPHRWDGIRLGLNASHNEFPHYADCSAGATYWLWNGLWIPYHVRDTVNGQHWAAGFTGTMLTHGKRVQRLSNVTVGDCIIYGGGSGSHTAMCVGRVNGKPMVISHGSEAGPFYLPYDYRTDINQWRRYI